MMRDLQETINETAVSTAIVRTLPPNVVKGRVQGAPELRRIWTRMSIQPMPTKELMLLPEGMRNQGAVKCYSPIELLTVETCGGTLPDRFDYLGATWQAWKVDDWRDVGGYWKVIAVRVTR